METYIVPKELVHALRKYLGTRPFDEVVDGVVGLNKVIQEQGQQKAEVKEEEKEVSGETSEEVAAP